MPIHPRPGLPAPSPVSTFPQVTEMFRRILSVLAPIRTGQLDCVTELTLRANFATTVLDDFRLSKQTVIQFDPKTLNASTEKAAGTIFVWEADRGSGTWTITHANNAQTDRIYQVSFIG